MAAGRNGRSSEEHRILRVLRKMPYASHLRTPGIEEAVSERRPLTMEDIAEYLETLRDLLEKAASDEKTTEMELSGLRGDMRGAGNLLRRIGLQVGMEGGSDE